MRRLNRQALVVCRLTEHGLPLCQRILLLQRKLGEAPAHDFLAELDLLIDFGSVCLKDCLEGWLAQRRKLIEAPLEQLKQLVQLVLDARLSRQVVRDHGALSGCA